MGKRTKKKQKNNKNNRICLNDLKIINDYRFETGHFYIVKSLDHFSGENSVDKNSYCYIYTCGVFFSEDKFHYRFKSFFYGDREGKANVFEDGEYFAILKNTIIDIKKLEIPAEF